MKTDERKCKRKILAVFGTRPEAIKLAPLIKAFERSRRLELFLCVSAQHRDMLDGVLEEFEIRPHYDMDLMRHAQTLSHISEEILRRLPPILSELSPDMLMVQGDTATAFAAALCAFYSSIPVAHVEAGLRSGDIFSPYPEEFNRRAISLMSELHFAPTEQAKQNLIAEGVSVEKIFTVGNTAIDAILKNEQACHDINDLTDGRPYALLTLHRREQSELSVDSIFSAVKRIANAHPQIRIIYPVHKNPSLSKKAADAFFDTANVILCPPIKPGRFHALLRSAEFIMSDSGGIQEEAVFLGKPTLVLRKTTERPEGIASGNLMTVGDDGDMIYEMANRLICDPELYARMSRPSRVYGDGRASERIISVLEKLL